MNRISLCLICGNTSAYIERCLKSFLPMADEVCVVRAIGKQEPDATMDLARATVSDYNKESGRSVVFKSDEYRNKPGHEDWPHVDDFAAARQRSYDLASGDYCFWCDTDDVLPPGMAEKIRRHAAVGGYANF